MFLDCIPTDDEKGWRIVDMDNSCKEIATSDSVEGAWYYAAKTLQAMINSASSYLKT